MVLIGQVVCFGVLLFVIGGGEIDKSIALLLADEMIDLAGFTGPESSTVEYDGSAGGMKRLLLGRCVLILQLKARHVERARQVERGVTAKVEDWGSDSPSSPPTPDQCVKHFFLCLQCLAFFGYPPLDKTEKAFSIRFCCSLKHTAFFDETYHLLSHCGPLLQLPLFHLFKVKVVLL